LNRIYRDIIKSPKKQIVEEYIDQKGFFHDLNPGSVNTLRVTTIRIQDSIRILNAYLRTGYGMSLVDNLHSGGILFEVDVKKGTISEGHTYREFDIVSHPYANIRVAGRVIEQWKEIVGYVTRAHLHAPKGLHLIGWDVCINGNQLLLIEGNAGPGFAGLPDPEEDQWKEIQEYLDWICNNKHTKQV